LFEQVISKNLVTNSYSKIAYIVNYFINLKTAFHNFASLWGFVIFIVIANQCISGTMLSFSLMNDSLLVSLSREEEDSENNYTDDFFWLHERGVDLVVVSAFFHFFRKVYLGVNDIEQEISWKTGVFIFLMIQVVIFTGLVLCTTHLSEITLVIAANIMHTFFLFIAKPYWWLFTDKFLNTDTMVRLMYMHYVSAFFVFYLGLMHGVDMHYDWKPKAMYSGIKQQLNWWDEVLANELILLLNFLIVLGCICEILYSEPEALSYEIFMWGDIGIVTDVRFYGVAPHWYFRPYMAWLIACPYHYAGIFGLIFFFFIMYFQVSIFGSSEFENFKVNNSIYFIWQELYSIIATNKYLNKFVPNIIIRHFEKKKQSFLKNCNHWNTINYDISFQWYISYGFFMISIAYTLTYLPYGRFYNRLGGNLMFLIAYFYIFSFLTFLFLRNSWLLNNFKLNIINY